MAGPVIHVFSEHAASIRTRIVEVAPDREVIAWTERAQLCAGIGEVEVLFAPRPPRDGWTGARALRLVQMLGAGVDQLLPSPDLPDEVEVAGVRGVFAPEAAEHAIAMVLAQCRGLPSFLDDQRERRFRQRPVASVAGKTVTLLGVGEIGARVARAAVALGMRVVGVARHPRGVEHVEEMFASDRLAEALAGTDYLVVALPRTPETQGLLDGAMLAHLPPRAFLVNLARGGILDESALCEALREGRLAGAALDVFGEEPLPPDSPLWSAPNTILTPHVAGYGQRYVERCIEILLENVRRLERGAPRILLVDRRRGY